jgi:hypothetical protein
MRPSWGVTNKEQVFKDYLKPMLSIPGIDPFPAKTNDHIDVHDKDRVFMGVDGAARSGWISQAEGKPDWPSLVVNPNNRSESELI